MEYIIPCNLKLNLSLRITGRRDDGYHELCSVFLIKNGPETLTLKLSGRDNVRDTIVVHNGEIRGENIVEKAARILRDHGTDIPPLEIHIWKQIPPGSGLGSGSGNAASLIQWTKRHTGDHIGEEILAQVGADVPFMCGTSSLSLVTGIGEVHEDLPGRLGLAALILFPKWTSPTTRAYKLLDARCLHTGENWHSDRERAKDEALYILERLRHRQRVGLLPNDFTPVLMDKFPRYSKFFEAAEACGSPGYGITGSGSACFALFDNQEDMRVLSAVCRSLAWAKKILVLE